MVRRAGPDRGARAGLKTSLVNRALRLRVNGQERELVSSDSGATVLDLLASLDQHPKTVAVELNRELVPRARFGETALRDGDRVEIVRFVQGGSGAGDRV